MNKWPVVPTQKAFKLIQKMFWGWSSLRAHDHNYKAKVHALDVFEQNTNIQAKKKYVRQRHVVEIIISAMIIMFDKADVDVHDHNDNFRDGG